MAIEYISDTGKLAYEGKEIGECFYENGKAVVTFECSEDEWMIPISWLAYGLSRLEKYQIKRSSENADLTIKTDYESIEQELPALRFLEEKTIKSNGFVWSFHKNDADPWPSLLHGHDYEKRLKLDVITGNIYDSATRECCKVLKQRDLKYIQEILRQSSDFHAKVVALIGS